LLVVQGIYITFVRGVKNPNASMLPLLRFQINCIAELYSIDAHASYRHAFVYLRQLAILLRQKRIDHKDLVSIYNAQIIYSMRVWARVISNSSSDSPLQSLVYPFVEIALGMISLRFVSILLYIWWSSDQC
jgi:nucleolar complex protein 2